MPPWLHPSRRAARGLVYAGCVHLPALAAPQDEVLDLHGEERGKAALLRTMLRIARRTTRPWAKPDDSPAENAPQRTSFCFLPRGATAAGADRRGNCSAGRPES